MATDHPASDSSFRRSIPAWVPLILIIATLASTWFFHQWTLDSMTESTAMDLEALAKSKALQVKQLGRERLADARVLANTPLVHDAIVGLRKEGAANHSSTEALTRHLATVTDAYGYRRAFVQVLEPGVRIPPTELPDSGEVDAVIEHAVRTGGPVMSEVHPAAPDRNRAVIDIAAPVRDDNGEAIDVVVLCAFANDILFPVMEADSLPQSRSVAILRSNGDRLWFGAMDAKGLIDQAESLSSPRLKALAEAIRRGGGLFEGATPSGDDVIAFLEPVDSWRIMVWVDADEIASVARQQASLVLLSLLVIILLLAFVARRVTMLLGSAETERRRQQYLLRIAGESASFGGWSMSLADERVEWTREVYDIFEATADQSDRTYQDILEFIDADDRELLNARIQQCTSEGTPYDLRLQITTAAGNRKWIRAIGQPTRDSDGSIIGVHGACQDITEQRFTAAELEAANDMLSRTMDSLDEAVFVVRPDGREILRCNRAVEKMLGYRREEVIGQSTEMLYASAEDWREFGRRSEQALNDFGIFHGEFKLRHRDGHLIATAHTVTPLSGDEWEGGVVSVVRNISAEKAAEVQQRQLSAQLSQAQKMEAIGRLAGGLAHDYNNMLGVIRGYTELAIEHLADDDPARGELDEVLSAAHRSAQLTRQLLGFARQQAVSPRVLDLNDTVRTMSRMLSRLIGEHIELEWHPGEDLWPVYIDPSQLDQVLANLVVNARDALGDHGAVALTTSNVTIEDGEVTDLPPGEYVRLSIVDSGHGIDPEIIDHIFEPFFTTKEQGTGTGLGLATVFGIMSQNHGAIVAGNEPDRGARFDVYLPRAEDSANAPLPATGAESMPGGKETILLVEDEEALLKLGERILKRLGYEVISTTRPGEALEIAADASRRIDLLVTDLVMPRIHGRDLAQRVRDGRPDLRVLMMSGYSADTTDGNHILVNGDVFIEKPFSSAALAEKVREAIGERANNGGSSPEP